MEIIGNHKEIKVQAANLYGVGVCDVGRVRKNNEDNMVLRKLWSDNYVLAIAIDGVGGQEGGEVAAAIAAESISNFLDTYRNGDPLELLGQAVQQANNDIFARREQEPKLAYMSCVLTAAILDSRRSLVYMAHVGDTRLYLYDDTGFRKLSHDHSVVGYREEQGDLSEEEAMHHPQRNIISRDVGSEHFDSMGLIETATFPLYGKSILLLCSDGLCDMITSSNMSGILCGRDSLDDRCRCLVDAALEAGGRDNVTVLLVEHDSDKTRPVKEKVEYVAEPDKSQDKAPDVAVSPEKETEGASAKENNESSGQEAIVVPEKKARKPKVWKNILVVIFIAVLAAVLGGLATLLWISRPVAPQDDVPVVDTTVRNVLWNPYVSEKEDVKDYSTVAAICSNSLEVMSVSRVAEQFEYSCYNSLKDHLDEGYTAVAIQNEVLCESFVKKGDSVWVECIPVRKNGDNVYFEAKMFSGQAIAAQGKLTFAIVNND